MAAQTIVLKIGTSSLTRPESGDLNLSTIARLVETIVRLRRSGHRVILVSSGAVGVGCARLDMAERPRELAIKQAVAAVGQGRLIRIYDDLFATFRQPVAQVLLTRANLIQRQHYVNVHATFRALLDLGVVPIVNENDTVAVEELKFGDNDTLSALVASLIEAQWLFLLTDVDRLYSADPRLNPDARPIVTVSPQELQALAVSTETTRTRGSQWGTGGMATKLSAARIATTAGVRVAIAKGSEPEQIFAILQGEPHGTQFEPQPRTTNARKRWIAYGLVPNGQLLLDAGAVEAVAQKGRSLLPAGIVAIDGQFEAQDAVSLCDRAGKEFARGICNYSSQHLAKILGCKTEDIPQRLGYDGEPTVVHRDNLVVLEGGLSH